MLFNSHEYLFVFLPLTAIVYAILVRTGSRSALTWLTVASLGFYAWWNPANLSLLGLSLAGNFFLGRVIERSSSDTIRRLALTLGLVGNLAALIHYKYAGFLVENLNLLLGTAWTLKSAELPLGISFFTFQQIAYLCDTYHRKMTAHSAVEYGLFVTFFPQLIAGPIVRPDDILPQFRRDRTEQSPTATDLAVGLTQFMLGLFKKAVLADGVAVYVGPVFLAAHEGTSLSGLAAWGGVLAYAFQLYFDFSGYSDMAMGSARLFGIRLPLNFAAPYQAVSISDFWRRWHMTLSSFLRDYLYIPLGGNRCSRGRRSLNLLITMLLGGLWHGAGWTFLLWGLWHGVALAIHQLWQETRGTKERQSAWWARPLTFLTVLGGWVLFRSASLTAAGTLFGALCGIRGWLPEDSTLAADGWMTQLIWLVGLGLLVWTVPHSGIWIERLERALAEGFPRVLILQRIPPEVWGAAVGLAFVVAILHIARVSEFMYFQF